MTKQNRDYSITQLPMPDGRPQTPRNIEWDTIVEQVKFKYSSLPDERYLAIVDEKHNVIFDDNLTLDEAKELIRRLMVIVYDIRRSNYE